MAIRILSIFSPTWLVDAYLIVNFSDGTRIQIWLPQDTIINDIDNLSLYATEDGSTYYGHSSKSAIPAAYPFIDMDPFYATRWQGNNLAISAFDARAQALGAVSAKSPAIDKGSLDFLSGGTTKTNVSIKETDYPYPLDGSEQEHPAPYYYSDPDSPSVLTYSLSHPIDLGYHYGARKQQSYNVILHTTLRHPKEAITDFEYTDEYENVYYLHPNEVSLTERLAIASSSFDNGRDNTIICFLTNYVEEWEWCESEHYLTLHSFIGYHRFRDDYTGIAMDLKPQQYPELPQEPPYKWSSIVKYITMTTSENSNGVEPETIYLAATMDLYVMYHTWFGMANRLLVYRYDPPYTWVPIAERIRYPDIYISDVALAADGNDLVVLWMEKCVEGCDDGNHFISGYRIANASTTNNLITLPANAIHYFNSDDFPSPVQPFINGDWDPDNGVQKPRISWTEKVNDIYILKAAQVDFGLPPYYQPIFPLSQINTISGSGINQASHPTIVVNRFSAPGVTHSNAKEAFTVFENYDNPLRTVNLESVNGNDSWEQPVSISGSSEEDPASITYRAFGTDRSAYITSNSALVTNTELIFNSQDIYTSFPVITTNKDNNTDIFMTFTASNYIMNMQIDP